MKILFFDSTNSWILVEAFEIKKDKLSEVYSFSGFFPKESSTRLALDIQNCLEKIQWIKPDFILSCNGPGSFSGIRVSIATAKSLSQIWKVPVYTMDSIELYSNYYFDIEKSEVIVSINSNKNTKKSYIGVFNQKKFIKSSEVSLDEIDKKKTIYTDNIDYLNGKLIQNNLPKSNSWIKKKLNLIKSLDLKKNHYHEIKPNYIRLSYFEK